MRIRRFHHFRRMMCLLLLCIWSFATMFYLWKQIKEKDEYTLLKNAMRRDRVPSKYKFATNFTSLQDNTDFINSVIQDIKNSIYNKESKITLRKRPKHKIDYGNDRDIDVEGVHDYMLWFENFQNNNIQLPTLARHQTCTKPIQNVALLKTHFTGSDVITNILNRFGDLNNLNVALPGDGLSTFFWPMRFQWKYIDITLLNGSLPNIISNHARYNNDVMDNILNPGSVYITILRDPVSQLETTFNNLGFGGLLQVTNTTDQLKKFLQHPKYYIQGVVRRKRFKDTLNLIKNGQFFDLGLATTDYHRKSIIKSTVKDLYEKFAVVLIYEYLDESLVLMKRKLCWQLDDILYLKFHQRAPNVWNRNIIPDDLATMIRKWNAADQELYNFFNKTLWEEIKLEGDNFWDEVKEFRGKLFEMENECMSSQQISDTTADKFTLLDIPSEKPPTKTIPPKVKLKDTHEQPEKSSSLLHLNKYPFNMDVPINHVNKVRTTSFTAPTHENDLFRNLTRNKKTTLKDVLMYTNLIHDKELLRLNDETHDQVNTQETTNYTNESTERTENIPNLIENNQTLPHKLYDTEGSGSLPILKNIITNTERMLSRTASSWNSYFCKKLLMSEQEYLDHFRIKHAYAKAEMRKK